MCRSPLRTTPKALKLSPYHTTSLKLSPGGRLHRDPNSNHDVLDPEVVHRYCARGKSFPHNAGVDGDKSQETPGALRAAASTPDVAYARELVGDSEVDESEDGDDLSPLSRKSKTRDMSTTTTTELTKREVRETGRTYRTLESRRGVFGVQGQRQTRVESPGSANDGRLMGMPNPDPPTYANDNSHPSPTVIIPRTSLLDTPEPHTRQSAVKFRQRQQKLAHHPTNPSSAAGSEDVIHADHITTLTDLRAHNETLLTNNHTLQVARDSETARAERLWTGARAWMGIYSAEEERRRIAVAEARGELALTWGELVTALARRGRLATIAEWVFLIAVGGLLALVGTRWLMATELEYIDGVRRSEFGLK